MVLVGCEDGKLTVPDVLDERINSAKERLREEGFSDISFAPGDPASARHCFVEDQDPPAGEQVAQGAEIELEATCEVPDVTGDAAEDATAVLDDRGFAVVYDPDDPVDPASCEVESQDPEGGDRLDPFDDVELTIACDVPDVTGEDGETATQELEAAGFEWSMDEPDCDVDPGSCTVLSQDPFDAAEPGTQIDLLMSIDEGRYDGFPEEDDGYEDDFSDESGCEPGYDPCLESGAGDYDCEGGTGDGPNYTGTVSVDQSYGDPFDLDRDGDGIGCDDY
jgi:beta-lactam-binding protein with PASTA domain